MKTHYYPFGFPEDTEQAPCGTWFGIDSDVSGFWENVTCSKCKRNKKRIMKAIDVDEKSIIEQMGDMVEFMQREKT